MNWSETKAFLKPCFPDVVNEAVNGAAEGELQEIRFRSGQKCQLRTQAGIKEIAWAPHQREIETLAEALCGHSLYARQDEIRQGYITLKGGHRLGLCGAVQMQNGMPHTVTHTGSLCLRIAAQWPGAADEVIAYCRSGRQPQSLLMIGPCGSGKTTLLRDIARQLGQGGTQTAIVDERGELAACEKGVPQLDVGTSTDVLDGCAKTEGIPWLIRSMSPEVIITDELATTEDVAAVMDAMACGCAVIASVHGASLNDLASRPVMAALMARRLFSHFAVLSPDGCGQVAAIYDKNGSPVRWRS